MTHEGFRLLRGVSLQRLAVDDQLALGVGHRRIANLALFGVTDTARKHVNQRRRLRGDALHVVGGGFRVALRCGCLLRYGRLSPLRPLRVPFGLSERCIRRDRIPGIFKRNATLDASQPSLRRHAHGLTVGRCRRVGERWLPRSLTRGSGDFASLGCVPLRCHASAGLFGRRSRFRVLTSLSLLDRLRLGHRVDGLQCSAHAGHESFRPFNGQVRDNRRFAWAFADCRGGRALKLCVDGRLLCRGRGVPGQCLCDPPDEQSGLLACDHLGDCVFIAGIPGRQ